MKDSELADIIIERFNRLIEDDDIRSDISRLIETRISYSKATEEHPAIQVSEDGVGFLGVLNGIIGTIPEDPHGGWGYICAEFNDCHKLIKFKRT